MVTFQEVWQCSEITGMEYKPGEVVLREVLE